MPLKTWDDLPMLICAIRSDHGPINGLCYVGWVNTFETILKILMKNYYILKKNKQCQYLYEPTRWTPPPPPLMINQILYE